MSSKATRLRLWILRGLAVSLRGFYVPASGSHQSKFRLQVHDQSRVLAICRRCKRVECMSSSALNLSILQVLSKFSCSALVCNGTQCLCWDPQGLRLCFELGMMAARVNFSRFERPGVTETPNQCSPASSLKFRKYSRPQRSVTSG